MQLSPDGPYTSIGTQRGDPEDHEPIDRKRMARLSSQMSRSHHPVEKAMAPVPVRDARQSFPPFDGVFSPFKHGSIRHGRTARTADRAVLVELRRFLAGVHAHWDVPDVHAPISTHPRRSAFKIRLQGAVSCAVSLRPSIIVPALENRWRSFNSTIRLRQACRSPYSPSTRVTRLTDGPPGPGGLAADRLVG